MSTQHPESAWHLDRSVHSARSGDEKLRASHAGALKALGLGGYVLVIGFVALAVLAIGAAAGGMGGAPWLAAGAAVAFVVAAAMITVSRRRLADRSVRERAQQDPLQPETSEEEEAVYEWRFHDRRPQ